MDLIISLVVLGNGTDTCKKVLVAKTNIFSDEGSQSTSQHHHLLQRSRSFWQVTPHGGRYLSQWFQRLGIPCSSLTNTSTWTMMRNAWLSGTETNLLSTSWFIQHLEHLAYLQLVLLLSEFLARVVLFYFHHLTAHACLTAYCLDLNS